MNKKLILMLAVAALFMTSCSVTKEVRSQRNLLSGTWSLNNISYENNTGTFSSLLFNDAKDICFKNSEWFFRDNNSTGRYTIPSGSLCTGGDRYIKWSVVGREGLSNQLQFKSINEKNKDVSGGFGYRLDIVSLTPQAMTLKSDVSVDGSPVTVVYEFTKK
ncbi:MAG: lipocalin family protein [Flavobacteriales bacterium]